MTGSWAMRVFSVFLILLVAGCLYDEKKVRSSYSDESLRAEAARNTPARWKVPVANAIVDDMVFQSDGRILVGLRAKIHTPDKPTIILLDSKTGREIWRYKPGYKAELSRLLILKDLIVYRVDRVVDDKDRTKLVAIDAKTGTVRWQSPEMGGERASFIPSPLGGDMLAVSYDESRATIMALSLSSGAKRWERSFTNATDGAPPPIADDDGILAFFGGVERISASDGKTRWRRKEIKLSITSPAARLAGNSIFVSDVSGNLSRLNRKSGKVIWKSRNPTGNAAITNIFPLNGRIYLRGALADGTSENTVLVALKAKTGKTAWRFDSPAIITSNFLEGRNSLFYATSSGVGALNLATGRQRFFTTLTNAGRAYPVRIRRYGENIVFIGELIVASVNMAQGNTTYSHGFDPVNNEATLLAADARLAALMKDPENPLAHGSNIARIASVEAARYQEESNRYAESAREHMRDHNRGAQATSDMSLIRARGAMAQAQISAEFSRAASTVAFTGAGMAAAEEFAKATNRRVAKEEKYRQSYLRASILLNYLAMESGEYVARPVRDARTRVNQFVGVAVIHLPTGKLARTNISAPHDVFGLWNLVDMQNGIAYHNGVGLEPADFEYSGELGMFGGTDYLKTFLIAQPIEMPH